jgi:hypothetical protein
MNNDIASKLVDESITIGGKEVETLEETRSRASIIGNLMVLDLERVNIETLEVARSRSHDC